MLLRPVCPTREPAFCFASPTHLLLVSSSINLYCDKSISMQASQTAETCVVEVLDMNAGRLETRERNPEEISVRSNVQLQTTGMYW